MFRFSSARRNRSPFTAFVSHSDGNVAIMFALLLAILFGMVGLGVDVGNAYRIRTKSQAAADAAALAAVIAAKNFISMQSSTTQSTVAEAQQFLTTQAQAYFAYNNADRALSGASPTTSLKLENGSLSATVTYNSTMQTAFSKVLGFNTLPISVNSTAKASLPPYVEVHLLIDTSGSMALGASEADQSTLVSRTGCAFACHDGTPVNGYPDAYSYAVSNGITLRYTAVNRGIVALMDQIDSLDQGHQFVNVAVYSFDNALTVNSALTSNTSTVRANLPTAPATSSMTGGATHFNEIISDVTAKIGASGDGSSPSSAIKLIMIATDGVQDPGRYWTTDIAARNLVTAFDTSF